MFLPNKFMRYTAALRIYISNLILKNGIRSKDIEALRKIHNAQVLFSQEDPLPLSLSQYLASLLTAVFVAKAEQGLSFSFKINSEGNYILPIKTFTALILNLCRTSEIVEISVKNGKLLIKSGAENKHSRRYTEKLNGCVYYERITDKALTVLPVSATDKRQTVITKTAEDYLCDPLSVVNIYIT